MRIRSWVIGVTFVAFGVSSHAALKVDPLPGRIEMGQFAGFELILDAAGLGLALVSLVSTPMGFARRVAWSILWILAVLAALVAVIDSLPS